MGLLTVGRPLTWEESKKYTDKVRHDGVAQFIATYKRLRDRKDDELKFGDEVLVIVCVGGGGCLYVDCVDLLPGEASCCRQVSVLHHR